MSTTTKQITVPFEFNELQWKSISELARILPGTSYVNIIIRYEGENKHFEGDWLKAISKVIEKENQQ